ncbi:hypothetical protein PT974_06216 [Cladobotryum mycophilum]|uniref:Fibronectin type-III domain-containing protein n=1 Tax=Cladobotryum mycophilum TaxID=491253 RepID=A0ABR0SKW3_9HYPO
MSWELPALTFLSFCAVGCWWIGSPQPSYRKALYVLVCAIALLVDPRQLVQRMFSDAQEVISDFRLDELLAQHFKMVLTLSAVLWLLHRSWQTLWKPVPDLINILGVDIPEPPDVSLGGIRSDAATLSWARPSTNRPVQRYSIQVNGVHVGDSSGTEVAITVTGLKPNHFYNIRVVAVGPNNFQAGSPLLRLRTLGKDGRPHLGNSRLPTSFTDPDQPRMGFGDDENDDSDDPTFSMPSVESAPMLEGLSSTLRDPNGTAPGQRRNTINRRHSPSVASMDQPQIRLPIHDGPELSLDELNRNFEGIRKEIDDTLSLYAKDEAESQQQEEELKREKERKKQILREKEEQTAQLKAMARSTAEQMRTAEKERTKKELQLKEKEIKKSKVRDSIAKFEGEMQRMKKEREGFEAQKLELAKKRDCDVLKLDESNAELQEKCAELEAELKDKGKQLQDLKETREQLPDAHDEPWKDEDIRLKREWDAKGKELRNRLMMEGKQGQMLDQQIRLLTEQLSHHQSTIAYYNQAGASNVDYDLSPSTQSKRLSHHSISLPNTNLPSPGPLISAEPSFPAAAGFSHASFASGLFMDIAADGASDHQTEAELRASNGPLSPSAQTLLPSNIFDEIEETDTKERLSPFPTDPIAAGIEDPQSPASSLRSFNYFSSPHGSSQNLPFPQYGDSNDRRHSVALNHSATSPPPSSHRFSSILAPFHRNRGPKPTEEEGPAIGTLKPGQSQSFPRQTDDHEIMENRRKLNFSWMNRNSAGPDDLMRSPFSSSKPSYTRRLNPFASSNGGLFPERDPDGSRPASIASTDLPRPSTDSGSIWGAPGDAALLGKNRLWSPSDARWPSRAGSRRPSLHGTTSVLTTTLASADDEILDEHDLLDPQTSPSQVGVIGSRPPGAAKLMSQRLNPAAPTFMGNLLFRKDRGSDRDRESGNEKEKSKGKEKGRERKDEKGKGHEATTPSIEYPPILDNSPSESRISRDAYSVHTQTSVSESRESLTLDLTLSNTPSDAHSNAGSISRDQENVVRKLFRKGSSSKFSLSSRLGKDSGLFKKGPGSATNSDRNTSADHRSSIGDVDDLGEDMSQFGRSLDSVASSPSLAPSKSKESKENRITSWRFSMKKKNKDSSSKEKESLDLDRPTDDE